MMMNTTVDFRRLPHHWPRLTRGRPGQTASGILELWAVGVDRWEGRGRGNEALGGSGVGESGKWGGGIQGGWLLVSNVAAADPITSRSCRIQCFCLIMRFCEQTYSFCKTPKTISQCQRNVRFSYIHNQWRCLALIERKYRGKYLLQK